MHYVGTGNHQIGCYSPLVQVDAKYINLLHPKGEPLTLQFDFKNYKRNMQIPLKDGTGMALTLYELMHLSSSSSSSLIILSTTFVIHLFTYLYLYILQYFGVYIYIYLRRYIYIYIYSSILRQPELLTTDTDRFLFLSLSPFFFSPTCTVRLIYI